MEFPMFIFINYTICKVHGNVLNYKHVTLLHKQTEQNTIVQFSFVVLQNLHNCSELKSHKQAWGRNPLFIHKAVNLCLK